MRDALRLDHFRVELELGVDLLVELFLVVLVEDGEGMLHAEARRLVLEQAQAGAVEGGDPRCLQADEPQHTLLHLTGSLVGEGDRQDAVGSHLLGLDDIADAMGDDAGLARTGAGDDQQGAVKGGDRLLLRLVHASEGVEHGGYAPEQGAGSGERGKQRS